MPGLLKERSSKMLKLSPCVEEAHLMSDEETPGKFRRTSLVPAFYLSEAETHGSTEDHKQARSLQLKSLNRGDVISSYSSCKTKQFRKARGCR